MNWKRELVDYILIIVGSFIAAVGYVVFLIPAHVAPGGVSGMAIVIHYLTRAPFGMTALVLNIPIFLWGIREFGRIFGVKSFVGTVLLSGFADFLTYVVHLSAVTSDRLLCSLYGGVLLGLGLGLTFRGRGSTGGTDIVGRIINKHFSLPVGLSILLVDSFVIALAGLTFGSFEPVLYSYIALFLSSKVIDIVLEGRDYARGVFIFSRNKADKIAMAIIEQLNRGVTALSGKGGFTGTEMNVLFTVVSLREVSKLRHITQEIDPNAFVVVVNVYEVLGKGFAPRTVSMEG